jgi:hypothetical protein
VCGSSSERAFAVGGVYDPSVDRRILGSAIVAVALVGCFFPSLDGLTDGGPDASSIDAMTDALDAAQAEAGLCPPNSDPTLALYYPFDEGSGTIVHDCSGHGYDGIITGSPAKWAVGHHGSSVLFVSSNDNCVAVSSSAANQTAAFTVSVWAYANGGNGGYLVGQRQQTGYGWRVDIEGSDAGPDLGFAVGTGDGSGNDQYADTIVQTNQWHHVAAVFAPGGSTQALYIDGVKVPAGTPALSITSDPLGSNIRIGCRGDDTNYFEGTIDEVRVYSRALSDAEITALASE